MDIEEERKLRGGPMASGNLDESMKREQAGPTGGLPGGPVGEGSLGSSSLGGGQRKSMKETFREGSPEEIRERMKQTVAKGVAAVAGALRGFTEESKKDELAKQTKESIRQAGETARSAVGTTTEEVRNLKQPVKEATSTIGETARDVGKSAKEEYGRTRDEMKGGRGMGRTEPDAVIAYEETTIVTPPEEEERRRREGI